MFCFAFTPQFEAVISTKHVFVGALAGFKQSSCSCTEIIFSPKFIFLIAFQTSPHSDELPYSHLDVIGKL